MKRGDRVTLRSEQGDLYGVYLGPGSFVPSRHCILVLREDGKTLEPMLADLLVHHGCVIPRDEEREVDLAYAGSVWQRAGAP